MLFIVAVILAVLVVIKVYSKLTLGRCTSPSCLNGKTALVTGGNSGMGYHTAMALATRGCRVIIADKDNCDKTKADIIEQTGNINIVTKYFNLASLKSVRKLAKDINDTEERLDILINNAGVSGIGNSYTEDGIHTAMQINHFGPFLLTHLLIGLLKKSTPSRIIFISSDSARLINGFTEQFIIPKDAPVTRFSEFFVYANSKLCNIITANELAKRLAGTGVTANSVHPGLVETPIIHNFFQRLRKVYYVMASVMYFVHLYIVGHFIKSAEEGAQTAIHLAVAQEVEGVTGKYFTDCRVMPTPFYANNSSYSKLVWETSEKLVKLTSEEKLQSRALNDLIRQK